LQNTNKILTSVGRDQPTSTVMADDQQKNQEAPPPTNERAQDLTGQRTAVREFPPAQLSDAENNPERHKQNVEGGHPEDADLRKSEEELRAEANEADTRTGLTPEQSNPAQAGEGSAADSARDHGEGQE
jgi:hypothetical protein